MTWDDEKLSVRQGPVIGKSSERRMIDAMGGQDTIKKRFQSNNDGSVTMAHTRGPGAQPEFVTSEPRGIDSLCALEMDSGIVDMIGISDYGPGLYSPAKIYQTDYVSAHVGLSPTAIGSGRLRYPSLSGNVVPNGSDAKAFSSSFSGGTSYMDRKKLAVKIPASLFTGRTRLFVQSLFGGNWPILVLADASGGAGRPILSVNLRSREQDGLQPALIGSGCGVYFDPVNKNHFLIQPGETSANVLPMICTACAEKYKLLLRNDKTLSEDDQERIESYILSQSFPIPELATILEYESTPSESLGYSWHWNWNGDRCDIIDVQETGVTDGAESFYGFSSTHYQLSFTNDGMNLSVMRSIVSGPEIWSVPKHINVIAYPDWINKRMTKAGNLPSKIMSGSRSGKVYCFYRKNDLKVVSVETETLSVTESRESYPEHFGGTYYPYITGFLIEKEDGESVARRINSGTSCHFSVDGSSVGGNSDSSTKTTHSEMWWKRMTVTEATGSGVDHDTYGTSVLVDSINMIDSGFANAPYSIDGLGRVVPGTPITYPDADTITGVNFITTTRDFYCSFWKKTDETVTEGRSVKTLIVVPFQDAEAVYISDQKTSIEEGTQTTGEISGIDVWGGTHIDVIYPGGPGYVHYGDYTVWRSTIGQPTRGYASGVTSALSRSSSTSSKSLVTSNGVYSVSMMPGEGDFYSTSNDVPQLYATLSSANGVVLSEDTGVQSGSNIYPHLSSFLGWA